MIRHDIPGGAAWSLRVRHGREVRFTALAPGANVSVLLLAGDDRLNIPDTLKAQLSARVWPPMVLMSDRGIGLASVTGSSLNWHDALCGHSTERDVSECASYQEHRNERRLSARTGLLSELRKNGYDRADLHATVNLFSKVTVDDDGRLTLQDKHCQEGDWVSLRAEVDLLMVLSTSPHPLATRWAPAPVRVEVTWAADDGGPRLFREQSARALEMAERVRG